MKNKIKLLTCKFWLQVKAKMTSQQSKEMASTVEEVNQFVSQFSEVLKEVSSNAKLTNDYALIIDSSIFIGLSKMSHIIFKNTGFSNVLHGKVDKKMSSHTACEFGKTYYDKSDGFGLSKMKSYSEIEVPHREVHNAMLEVMKVMDGIAPELVSQELVKHKGKVISNLMLAEEHSLKLFDVFDVLREEFINAVREERIM